MNINVLNPQNKTLVRVYFNLHKHVLSVQEKTAKGWRVAAHTPFLCLKNVKFKVSEAGRLRVIKEKKKNVHAFIEGEVSDWRECEEMPCHAVTYNPYVRGDFFFKDTGEGIDRANLIIISGKNIMA